LQLRLPLFRSFFVGEDNLDIPKNSGLVPQHIVITNLSDELKQTDTQLAYVRSLIATGGTIAPQADAVEGLAAIKQWRRKRYE